MQDLLPYETLASLWKRQTPTSIVIWRLFPSCGLRPLTTKKKKKQTNPNITNLSPLMTRWQPPQPNLPSPAPDIGACPRQSMKGGWRRVWLRTRGCWERSLFGESLPSRGPLPPFFWIWERGKREVQSRETSTLSGKGGRSNARGSPCRMEWTSLGTAV